MFGDGCSLWPTPTASDAGYFPDIELAAQEVSLKGPADIAAESGGQFSLSNAARQWSTLWMILQACGWRAEMLTSRSTPPVRVAFKHGKASFASGLISNPRFFEMAMGWPVGWTDAEAPVTGWSHWKRRSRGALCEVLSVFEGPEGACVAVQPES
ncbi:hypothetical protein [Phenylobacterium ferrooxidans]|uniref:Uncharacterized protein n=1 Tax=Phenylobacterium ferrooxidans TaxID=2982689 RepID=A0ABW6CMI2_9CAUL